MKRLLCWLFGHKWISTKDNYKNSNLNDFIISTVMYCKYNYICSRCSKIKEENNS